MIHTRAPNSRHIQSVCAHTHTHCICILCIYTLERVIYIYKYVNASMCVSINTNKIYFLCAHTYRCFRNMCAYKYIFV